MAPPDQIDPGTLLLKRLIPDVRATLRSRCLPGCITVLRDESGAVGGRYEQLLRGSSTDALFAAEYQGKPWSIDRARVAGFGDFEDEPLKVAEFLVSRGFTESETEVLLDQYDLRDFGYLSVRQLPATARRQLALLDALREKDGVLLLKDPFLPFNGRWREDFAVLLLEWAARQQRPVVVFGLSFMPKKWTESKQVRVVDLDKDAEALIFKQQAVLAAEREAERQAKERERQEREAAKVEAQRVAQQEIVAAKAKQPREAAGDPSEGKLAAISMVMRIQRFTESVRSLRSNSGMIAAVSFCFVVLMLGFTMLPEARKGWTTIHELAEKHDIPWSKLLTSASQEPPSATQEAVVQPAEVGPQVALIAPDVLPEVDARPVLVEELAPVEVVPLQFSTLSNPVTEWLSEYSSARNEQLQCDDSIMTVAPF